MNKYKEFYINKNLLNINISDFSYNNASWEDLYWLSKYLCEIPNDVNIDDILFLTTKCLELLQDIEEFYAGHTDPAFPAGTLGVKPGPVMAAPDGFTIRIHGKGAHAGDPETIESGGRTKLGLVMPGEKIFYDVGN